MVTDARSLFCGITLSFGLVACGSTVVTQGGGGAGGIARDAAASTSSSSVVSSNGGSTASITSSHSSNASSSGSTASSDSASSTTGALPDCSNGACVGTSLQGGCDAGLAIDSADAMDGARAIGLCQLATNGSWGVKSAGWVRADGTALGMGDGGPDGMGDLQLGRGILAGFGTEIQPLEGSKLLSLSSGSARQPSDGASYHTITYWKDNTSGAEPDERDDPVYDIGRRDRG